MRLIRSKGVGVYFVTQNPLDVPDTVLAQLGNRIQHALRAYTPREQKAVKASAETFRPNPDFDCAAAITQLGVGEALVSTLEAKGVPSMVQRTLIRPPSSRLGPITDAERAQIQALSPVAGQYDKTIDRESAFEMLQKRAEEAADAAEREAGERDGGRPRGPWGEQPDDGRREGDRWTPPDFGGKGRRDEEFEEEYRRRRPQSPSRTTSNRTRSPAPAPRPRTSNRQTVTEAAVKSVVRSVGSSLGRALVRGILGSLKR